MDANSSLLYYLSSDLQFGDCGYEKWENGLQAGLVSSIIAVGNTEIDSIRALSNGYFYHLFKMTANI